MLRQCEFNGRKDVLHFKLLQAAINENNANKISVKNPNQIVQKSVENSMLENNDYDKHREIKTYHQKHARSKNSDQYDSDEEQCQFQSYHRDDVAYANEKKKKRISSSMVPLHCEKSASIHDYFSPYFPVLGLLFSVFFRFSLYWDSRVKIREIYGPKRSCILALFSQ